jgi:hypothetical protein
VKNLLNSIERVRNEAQKKFEQNKIIDGEKARARMQTYGWIRNQLDQILEGITPVSNTVKRLSKLSKEETELTERYDRVNHSSPNTKCRHYTTFAGETYCDIKADMKFCTHQCAFADECGDWRIRKG